MVYVLVYTAYHFTLQNPTLTQGGWLHFRLCYYLDTKYRDNFILHTK